MSNGATPTVYVVSGPPSEGVSPVAPTLADAITAAQSSASQAGSSASSASASASAAATSAALAAAAEASVVAAESTVVADLNIAQADIVQLQNQIALINQTAQTLIGDIGAAESAASAAETAQSAAATSASTASTAATNAGASASAASTSATAASGSASGAAASAAAAMAAAAGVTSFNLLQVSNDLSELQFSVLTLLSNITGAAIASGVATPAVGVSAVIGDGVIVCVCATSADSVSALSDSAGNAYSKVVGQTTNGDAEIWYNGSLTHAIVAGSTTFTVTTTAAHTYFLPIAYRVPGGLTSDKTTSGNSASATSISLATGTLTNSNEVIVGIALLGGTPATYTEGAGFTNSANPIFGNHIDVAFEVVQATTTVTWAPSWTTSESYGAVLASFTATSSLLTSQTNARNNIGAAPLASPTFTGNPTAPTQTTADSTTKLATTAFVHAVSAGGGLLTAANNLSDVASVATSRVNLAIDQLTTQGDSNLTIANTTHVVAITAAFTAARQFTFPAASTCNHGQLLTVVDQARGVTGTNTLTFAPNGTDKINGTNATITFSDTGGVWIFVCDGTGAWTNDVVGIDRGGTGAITVSAARTNLGLTSAATMSLPVSVANGGTGTGTAGGTALDNISAFSGTGVVKRTGAGAYSFLTDVLESGVTATISVGYNVTPFNGGTVSSGTYTPAAANGNYQYLTNNGAFTLAVPAADCAIDILVTNGASAGTITFAAGYKVGANTGSPLTTTNTNQFVISIRTINAISTYSIYALQ
jgi:hypothetical protein